MLPSHQEVCAIVLALFAAYVPPAIFVVGGLWWNAVSDDLRSTWAVASAVSTLLPSASGVIANFGKSFCRN